MSSAGTRSNTAQNERAGAQGRRAGSGVRAALEAT